MERKGRAGLFGILLSLVMLIGLLPPAIARADEYEEEESHYTHIWIDSDGKFEEEDDWHPYWKVQGDEMVEATAEDYELWYDAATRTLTLRDYVFTSDYEFSPISADCDIKLQLIGTNKVTSHNDNALWIGGSLDITGTGSLEAVTTCEWNEEIQCAPAGMSVDGERFTIKDATLVCKSFSETADLSLFDVREEANFVNNGTIIGRVALGCEPNFIINAVWIDYINDSPYWKMNVYGGLSYGTESDYQLYYDRATQTIEFNNFIMNDDQRLSVGCFSDDVSATDTFAGGMLNIKLTGTNKIITNSGWWIAGDLSFKGSGSLELINADGGDYAYALACGGKKFVNECNLTFTAPYSDVDISFSNLTRENMINTGKINGRLKLDVEDNESDKKDENDKSKPVVQPPAAPPQSSTVVTTEAQWNDVAVKLSAATTGENLNVVTGEKANVPQNVLQAVQSSGKTLAMHTGKGLTYSVSKENLTNAMVNGGLDLTVVVGDSNIPENLLNQKTANAVLTREISMPNHSAFGGVVNMHWALGSENEGKYANLYRYNEKNSQLEYVGVYVINQDGQAMFGIVDGAEYLITVTAEKPAERMVRLSAGSEYVVGKGDTLSSIASRNNMSLQELLALNPAIKNPGMIRIGQKITVR